MAQRSLRGGQIWDAYVQASGYTHDYVLKAPGTPIPQWMGWEQVAKALGIKPSELASRCLFRYVEWRASLLLQISASHLLPSDTQKEEETELLADISLLPPSEPVRAPPPEAPLPPAHNAGKPAQAPTTTPAAAHNAGKPAQGPVPAAAPVPKTVAARQQQPPPHATAGAVLTRSPAKPVASPQSKPPAPVAVAPAKPVASPKPTAPLAAASAKPAAPPKPPAPVAALLAKLVASPKPTAALAAAPAKPAASPKPPAPVAALVAKLVASPKQAAAIAAPPAKPPAPAKPAPAPAAVASSSANDVTGHAQLGAAHTAAMKQPGGRLGVEQPKQVAALGKRKRVQFPLDRSSLLVTDELRQSWNTAFRRFTSENNLTCTLLRPMDPQDEAPPPPRKRPTATVPGNGNTSAGGVQQASPTRKATAPPVVRSPSAAQPSSAAGVAATGLPARGAAKASKKASAQPSEAAQPTVDMVGKSVEIAARPASRSRSNSELHVSSAVLPPLTTQHFLVNAPLTNPRLRPAQQPAALPAAPPTTDPASGHQAADVPALVRMEVSDVPVPVHVPAKHRDVSVPVHEPAKHRDIPVEPPVTTKEVSCPAPVAGSKRARGKTSLLTMNGKPTKHPPPQPPPQPPQATGGSAAAQQAQARPSTPPRPQATAPAPLSNQLPAQPPLPPPAVPQPPANPPPRAKPTSLDNPSPNKIRVKQEPRSPSRLTANQPVSGTAITGKPVPTSDALPPSPLPAHGPSTTKEIAKETPTKAAPVAAPPAPSPADAGTEEWADAEEGDIAHAAEIVQLASAAAAAATAPTIPAVAEPGAAAGTATTAITTASASAASAEAAQAAASGGSGRASSHRRSAAANNAAAAAAVPPPVVPASVGPQPAAPVGGVTKASGRQTRSAAVAIAAGPAKAEAVKIAAQALAAATAMLEATASPVIPSSRAPDAESTPKRMTRARVAEVSQQGSVGNTVGAGPASNAGGVEGVDAVVGGGKDGVVGGKGEETGRSSQGAGASSGGDDGRSQAGTRRTERRLVRGQAAAAVQATEGGEGPTDAVKELEVAPVPWNAGTRRSRLRQTDPPSSEAAPPVKLAPVPTAATSQTSAPATRAATRKQATTTHTDNDNTQHGSQGTQETLVKDAVPTAGGKQGEDDGDTLVIPETEQQEDNPMGGGGPTVTESHGGRMEEEDEEEEEEGVVVGMGMGMTATPASAVQTSAGMVQVSPYTLEDFEGLREAADVVAAFHPVLKQPLAARWVPAAVPPVDQMPTAEAVQAALAVHVAGDEGVCVCVAAEDGDGVVVGEPVQADERGGDAGERVEVDHVMGEAGVEDETVAGIVEEYMQLDVQGGVGVDVGVGGPGVEALAMHWDTIPFQTQAM